MEVKEASASYAGLTELPSEVVPFGYKQTEVGVIPQDWIVKAVHEFAGIMTGPFGTLLKAAEYSLGDGVPLISVGEVREGFFQITDHTPRVSVTVTKRLPQYLLKKGDVVFGRKGGVERSALIKDGQEGWFLGSDGIRVRQTGSMVNEYLAFQFRSKRVRNWLLQHAVGTTMPSLNQEVLRNVTVAVPPTKAEQEAIAEALSDADALVESLQQLIAKKRQIKQGTMQALLTGKQRLPDFSDDWTRVRLADCCDMKSGEAITSELINDGSRYPCFGGNGLRGYVDRYTHDGKFVLIGRQGALCGNVAFTSGRFFASEHAIVVTANAQSDPSWLAFLLERMNLNQYSESSAQPGLSVTKVLVLECNLPSREEQTAIAAILTDMDTELAELETRLAKTRQLKQGMMQALLTGWIRLV